MYFHKRSLDFLYTNTAKLNKDTATRQNRQYKSMSQSYQNTGSHYTCRQRLFRGNVCITFRAYIALYMQPFLYPRVSSVRTGMPHPRTRRELRSSENIVEILYRFVHTCLGYITSGSGLAAPM